MKLTIGIPCYNEEGTIKKVLKNTILALKVCRVNGEIIVVNDGSTDKTADIVSEFLGKVPFLKLINKKRGGKASAINTILKQAKGELVLIQDGDIIFEKEIYLKVLHHFRNEQAGMVVGRGLTKTKSPCPFLTFANKTIDELQHLLSLDQVRAKKIPKVYGAFYIFRKSLVRSIPKLIDDGDYIAYLVNKQGYKVLYEPEAIFYTSFFQSLSNYFKRRVRIITGQRYHRRITGVPVPSGKFSNNLFLLIKFLKHKKFKVNWFYLFSLVILECIIRFWASIKTKLGYKPFKY